MTQQAPSSAFTIALAVDSTEAQALTDLSIALATVNSRLSGPVAVVPDLDTRFRAAAELFDRLTARVEALESRVAELEAR